MQGLGNITVALGVIAAIVYGLSRILRLKPIVLNIPNPRRSSFVAIAMLATILTGAVLIALVWLWVTGKPATLDHATKQFGFSRLWIALAAIPVYSLPVLVAIKRAESLESIGITTRNLWQSIVIGLIISGLIVCFDARKLHALCLIGMSHVIALVFYAVVGFGEELLFRGFLQNRLVSWLGTWRGVLLTAAIFSLFHMPQMFMFEWNWNRVLAQTSCYIPISLFLGFVMLRTGNLMAVGLFHTFANWINVLRTLA